MWIISISIGIVLCGTTLAQFQNQPNTVPQQGFQQNQPNTVPQQGFPQQNQPNTVPQQGFPQQNQPMNPQQGFPQQSNFPQPNQNSGLPQQPGTNPLLQQPVANNAVPNTQQAPGNQAQQETCAAAGRTAVATCFQTNGGFQMAIVIALLSNGTQGQLPANANQIKDNLCRAQSQIVTCIIQSIASFNGTQQCKSLPAYIRLQQETTGLLTGVQQMCGTSHMPKVTVCMRRLNFDLMNCYNEVGLNPNLFSPSGSRMNGAIIGDNREIARMYCKAKDNLFACQDKVLDNCPRARELQALSGNDQKSMHDGITVLCKDVNVYVSGLVCFQSPTEEVDKCANKLVVDITELTMKQIQQSLPRNLFFREYCKIRIANLVCDSEAWGNKCEKAAVGLKREFQCNLLPAVCKNDTTIMDQYSSACAIPTFDRALRQDGNGAGLLTGSLANVLLGLLSASLFLI